MKKLFLLITVVIIFFGALVFWYVNQQKKELPNKNISISNTNDADNYVIDNEYTLNDYTFRSYYKKDDFGPGRYEILYKGKVVYSDKTAGISAKDTGFRYDVVMLTDDLKANQDLEIIRDITGDNIPNIIIQYFSGGAHCCFSYLILSLEDKIKKIDYLEGKHGGFEFSDLDKDGVFEAIGNDWTFAYWLVSFVDSPAPEVILKYSDGKYRIADNFMKKPALSANEIIALVKKVDFETTEISFTLWGKMLDLIYSGNRQQANDFFNQAWPKDYEFEDYLTNEKFNKEEFLQAFNKRLSSSPYWDKIKDISNL